MAAKKNITFRVPMRSINTPPCIARNSGSTFLAPTMMPISVAEAPSVRAQSGTATFIMSVSPLPNRPVA